ncbi:MAG: molybdopterin-dependent oxidoreductase [Halodesulfurarchaeum sp.]
MDQSGALADALAFQPQVTVVGEETFRVTPETLSSLEIETKAVEIVCATGSSYTADWLGPTAASLFEAASVPPGTTHLVVESADEYRVVVAVPEAIGGVLAYLKDGVPIGERQAYVNRFVAPGTEGARDIKGVARIEAVELEPDEDPESLENLFPEGERFTANRYEKDEATPVESDPDGSNAV